MMAAVTEASGQVPRLAAVRTMAHRDDQTFCVLRLTDNQGVEALYWLTCADLLALGKQMVADATLLEAEVVGTQT